MEAFPQLFSRRRENNLGHRRMAFLSSGVFVFPVFAIISPQRPARTERKSPHDLFRRSQWGIFQAKPRTAMLFREFRTWQNKIIFHQQQDESWQIIRRLGETFF
ncbi:hypothetical protein THTE_0724 [Thermogutta terrifontis]|uniref:Uncharacterized protein n=1 Tax=Thermogutta terrifontis TaxID=1331910 RepID=A0A286RBJ4_9BACT|nr:hypothetical protein THTE_0724 [Thermogutta terrifontis]